MGRAEWHDHVQLTLSGDVRHHYRDEVLNSVLRGSPRLSKTKDHQRARRASLSNGILLQGRSKVVCVVKDFCLLFLLEEVALLAGRRAAVDHRSAESCGVNVSVDHLQDQASGHGIVYVLEDGVRMHGVERHLVGVWGPKEPLEILFRDGRVLAAIGYPAAIVADDVLLVDGDGAIEHPDGEPVRVRRRDRGRRELRALQDVDELLYVLFLLTGLVLCCAWHGAGGRQCTAWKINEGEKN